MVMDSNGSLLVLIGPYSSQWNLMAANESSYVLMRLYGS